MEKPAKAKRVKTVKTVGDALMITIIGTVIGLAYNLIGLQGKPAYGLDWLAKPSSEKVAVLEQLNQGGDGEEEEYHDMDNPMGIFDAHDLPEIPVMDMPIQIQLPVVKKFFDAGGAFIVDARDKQEYLEGHIPGAVNIPFEVAYDPANLQSLNTGGRPIIVYCEGGECETSINVSWYLLEAGHSRVTYLLSGYSGWAEKGYPVETGEGEGY